MLDTNERVGYKKPPKETQFQKGRSGNPGGRPTRDPNFASVLRKVIKQIVYTSGPKSRRMSKLEAGITQLVNKAAIGDMKALKLLIQWLIRFPELITNPETIILNVFPVSPVQTPTDEKS